MGGHPKLLFWTAGLSILASIVHGLLVEEHFEEWWAFGVFFMLAATAQGLYGFAIVASHVMNGSPITDRWPRRNLQGFYLAGILGNAALVLTYVASRTVGVLGEVEDWEALGVFTKLVEVATAALLVRLLHLSRTRP